LVVDGARLLRILVVFEKRHHSVDGFCIADARRQPLATARFSSSAWVIDDEREVYNVRARHASGFTSVVALLVALAPRAFDLLLALALLALLALALLVLLVALVFRAFDLLVALALVVLLVALVLLAVDLLL